MFLSWFCISLCSCDNCSLMGVPLVKQEGLFMWGLCEWFLKKDCFFLHIKLMCLNFAGVGFITWYCVWRSWLVLVN